MLHLAAEHARSVGRRFALLFIDLEAQYQLTIAHVEACFTEYADVAEPFWVALPLHLRNAVSAFQPHWVCWDPAATDLWVRRPPTNAITDGATFPFFRPAMEFEEFVADFAAWYAGGQMMACMVGIRTDESLNRWRTVWGGRKAPFEGKRWTTWKDGPVVNAYPIADWKISDLWLYTHRFAKPYNALYDRMHQAGLTPHQMRICQPYGDDQRRGLNLFHVIEPETWGRVVARVCGANSGALYCGERGNILGNHKVFCPPGLSWQEFAELLLNSMPPRTAEHFKNKIAVFLKWYCDRGFPNGIPDEAAPADEAAKRVPSWRRICKALLRYDFWCKGLGFSQTKSTAFERYRRIMEARRRAWRIFST